MKSRKNYKYVDLITSEMAHAVPGTQKLLAEVEVQTGACLESKNGEAMNRKKPQRINEKVKLAYDWDYRQMTDYFRCSFVCESLAQILSVCQAVEERLIIIRIKNRFAKKYDVTLSGGYRDVQMCAYMSPPDEGDREEFVFEVQIHLKAVLDIESKLQSKDSTGSTGHQRYVQFRQINERLKRIEELSRTDRWHDYVDPPKHKHGFKSSSVRRSRSKVSSVHEKKSIKRTGRYILPTDAECMGERVEKLDTSLYEDTAMFQDPVNMNQHCDEMDSINQTLDTLNEKPKQDFPSSTFDLMQHVDSEAIRETLQSANESSNLHVNDRYTLEAQRDCKNLDMCLFKSTEQEKKALNTQYQNSCSSNDVGNEENNEYLNVYDNVLDDDAFFDDFLI